MQNRLHCHHPLIKPCQDLNHPGLFEEGGVRWNVLIANTHLLVVVDIAVSPETVRAAGVVEKKCKYNEIKHHYYSPKDKNIAKCTIILRLYNDNCIQ